MWEVWEVWEDGEEVLPPTLPTPPTPLGFLTSEKSKSTRGSALSVAMPQALRLLYETLRVSEAFALAIRSVQVPND